MLVKERQRHNGSIPEGDDDLYRYVAVSFYSPFLLPPFQLTQLLPETILSDFGIGMGRNNSRIVR